MRGLSIRAGEIIRIIVRERDGREIETTRRIKTAKTAGAEKRIRLAKKTETGKVTKTAKKTEAGKRTKIAKKTKTKKRTGIASEATAKVSCLRLRWNRENKIRTTLNAGMVSGVRADETAMVSARAAEE